MNKFKMTFDTRYIEKDGAIVCFVTPSMVDPFTQQATNAYKAIIGKSPSMTMPPYFKGVARRQEGDENNLEEGKAIARRKAIRTAYRWFANYNNYIYEQFQNKIEEYFVETMRIYSKADNITAEIEVIAQQSENGAKI